MANERLVFSFLSMAACVSVAHGFYCSDRLFSRLLELIPNFLKGREGCWVILATHEHRCSSIRISSRNLVMKTFLFAAMFFALQNMAFAQINVIGLPDTGKSSAVTQLFPNVTGAGTAGAIVHVWYASHHSGVGYDSAVVVPVTAVDGLAEGGQIPGGGGPLWRLKIAGNTSVTPWVFEGCTPLAPGLFEIARVEISLPSSQTAFDRVSLLGLNTAGSGPGTTFANGAVMTSGTGPMMVTYRYVNPMKLFPAVIGAGTPPKGDVFEKLDLNFYNSAFAPGGFVGDSWLEFLVDTDRFVP